MEAGRSGELPNERTGRPKEGRRARVTVTESVACAGELRCCVSGVLLTK